MNKLVYLFLMILFGWFGCESKPGMPHSKEAMEEKYAEARKKMVEEQLASWTRGIKNKKVLEAMEKVPRHEFVPDDVKNQAYEDYPLPIGYGQTISQPYIVAFMTEKLDPQPNHRVLEIGTGSGYQAAVLSLLVSEVYSIEIIEPLAKRAEETCKRLGYTNVFIKAGDGYKGWPEKAPFDSIIVTCAPEKIPEPLVEQLKDGGKMIIPVGPIWDQSLYLLVKSGNEIKKQAVLPVRFVPMTGEIEKKK
ncbi:MAG: protein-L-isoaspartate(D-aspartate) O-methyltransferase [Limisphaerales bacterium]|jgi:protein-L-isoaspartate(D-aspartate) O-methyltransferase